MPHVVIKIKIGLHPNGHAKYPDFNQIASNLRDRMDWSSYVDKHGGWHYDKLSGHSDEDIAESSPVGMQWGMLIVPEAFATEAISKFPSEVSIITEAEATIFYETRAHSHEPSIIENQEVLQTIVNKRSLGIAEDQQDKDALDPNHPSPGRRRNKLKTWVGFKKQRGIVLAP